MPGRRGWSAALSLTAVSVAVLIAAAVVVSIVNSRYCAGMLGSAAAWALFDATTADRAAVEGLESHPPVLVWLEDSPAVSVWLEDAQRCDGKSQLRILYRDEGDRASIQQQVDGSRLRDFGPVRLNLG